MIARVQKSENYYQALHIISEYVETELSEDFQKHQAAKKRGRKNADEVQPMIREDAWRKDCNYGVL